jgi:PleD family two-component response regulator
MSDPRPLRILLTHGVASTRHGVRGSMSTRRPLRILMLEDSSDAAEVVVRALRRAGLACRCERVDTEDAFLAVLDPPPDLRSL